MAHFLMTVDTPDPTDLSLARETPEDDRLASTPRAGEAWIEPATGMEFVWVPGGSYMMGSPLTEKISQIDFKAKPLWYKILAVVSTILPYGCVSSSTNSKSYSKAYSNKELNPKLYSIPSKSYYDIHGFQEDETPVHEVCLDGFWIGNYEVTQGQWKKIMESNTSHFKSGDDFPVESVSWNDAKVYIEKLSRQSGHRFVLPTEAQWEICSPKRREKRKICRRQSCGQRSLVFWKQR